MNFELPMSLPDDLSETLVQYGYDAALVDVEIDDVVAFFHDEYNARLIARYLNSSFDETSGKLSYKDRFFVFTGVVVGD